MATVCYLCGSELLDDVSSDHVPPKQLFARGIRAKFNLDRLVTLPAHGTCNGSFGRDEEYLVASLAPIADSPTSRVLFAEFAQSFRSGEKLGLGHRILDQMVDRPGGIILPRGLVAARVDGQRIQRVAWKIVRGLFTIETGKVLPESSNYLLELVEPQNRDPSDYAKFWNAVKAEPSKGLYRPVFDYKYLVLSAGENEIHLWGMLFWDRIMMFVSHRGLMSEKAAT